MLAEAFEVDLPAGGVIYRGVLHRETVVLALVVEGLLRVYMTSPEGRQVTIRYVTTSDVLGVPIVIGRGGPVDVQALTDCVLLRLSPERFRNLVGADPAVGLQVARELSRRVFQTSELLAQNVFFSVQRRVAHHLLDLAQREGDQLVVPAKQQDIADAIGTVREVVARALKRLRELGLIATCNGAIVLVDPSELHRVAQGE